ncbi:MAG: hypothetical protein J1F13_07135 [Prevotellaceae bacterium]|nr:hypothetical protein [Prevotellaceae bacterium]
MKNICLFLIVGVVMLTSCGQGGRKENLVDGDSVGRIIDQKNAEINNLLGTVNDIQDGLRQITEAQGRINELKREGAEGSAINDINEQMAFIRRTMEINNERIAELQKQLQNSNINVNNLRQTIESLQMQLNEKTLQIEQLTNELAERDIKIKDQANQISTLTDDNANLTQDKANLAQANEAKARTIGQQDKELNRAWYVFGTKRELKDHNILNSGDVLTQGFNRSYFTEIDIRNVSSIPLGSKSAKILTTHPAKSYSLDKNSDKTYTLRITDAALFWSVSRYLVIVVK